MAPRAKILVVEDEPGLQEILVLNLENNGYSVVTAAEGIEALRKFDEEQPDLVTLDLNVPGISGFRLLQLFKRDRATVPVVVVTAYSFEEAEEVAAGGARGFLSQPLRFLP